MNIKIVRWFGISVVALLVLPVSILRAQTLTASPAISNPAQDEVAAITKIYQAAKADDNATADMHLATASLINSRESSSITLARRSVAACGWLQNDNKYGAAIKLATRTLSTLGKLKEDNDADHAERLYWEAVLEGRILDHKAKAVTLLESARKLAPDDDRTLEFELELTQALAQFRR